MRLTRETGAAVEIRALVIAGWAGRDPAAVQHHIDELAALGVAPPSRTPLFYRCGANLLTTAPRVEVLGEASSGEAEALLVAGPDGWHVGLGSDHTDRAAEAQSVALSKQVCPKPVAPPTLWDYDDVAGHWDRLELRAWAWIDGVRVPYQDGPLAGLLPPADLVAALGGLPEGTALFCGTLPTLTGVVPAARFEMALEDPVLGRRLSHAYDIVPLPVVA